MSATSVDEAVPSETEALAAPPPAKFRYAVKTSLSLSLAYLIPMALGWPQPQTAATTVMLIAATGLLSESLQKGVLRVLGTVVGAILGLGLIALFPQDRMVYLLAASLVVATIIYLYNAFQGDSTVFMLAAVVTLMVFNGGDAEGAFLYGVDRAFMTAFGVLVYTVVASMLWPVKTADNTRALAAGMATGYRQAFERLVQPDTHREIPLDEYLAALLTDEEAFQTQFASAKNNADGVTDYLPEWNALVSCYEELGNILVPALKQETGTGVDFSHYIDNYDLLLTRVEAMYAGIDNTWRERPGETRPQVLQVELNTDSLHENTHLLAAAVATRAEILLRIQHVLSDLREALDALILDQPGFVSERRPRGKPAFIWLDLENFKTAVRAFITFWIATAIWITCNPPGGFTFVTMCTILIPLVSYTPVTPKLLFILFTLGFMFALPSYVFLLPQMDHWLELALFLFSYAFIGFYVFQGPVSIFFLLGLFTLGIQNTMNYHVDGILLTMLMFYMICATLIISTYFPFTSKPERIYASLRHRFFQFCAHRIRLDTAPVTAANRMSSILLGSGAALLTKMDTWGAKIDNAYFSDNGPEKVVALNRACELLHGQLQVMSARRPAFGKNPLIEAARQQSSGHPLATLCQNLAEQRSEQPFEHLRTGLTGIEERLNELLGEDYLDRYDPLQLAQFYVYLNLQASILGSIEACREAQQALDWRQLGETRF